MARVIEFFVASGMLISTTVGAGIFALPFIFKEAGWGLSLIYFIFLGVLMTVVHSLYFRVLAEVGSGKRVIGLIENYFGSVSSFLAKISVFGGLVLVLLAYLILAGRFFSLIFPNVDLEILVLVFWFFSSLPMVFTLRRFLGFELLGGLLMVGVVLIIFWNSIGYIGSINLEFLNSNKLFLPFGVVLFSLAGWTAIEPICEIRANRIDTKPRQRWLELLMGTFGSVLVYLIFVVAILNTAETVTPDTVSGLSGWSEASLVLLGVFGLFTLWTSYLPIGLEIKNLIKGDLKRSRALAASVVIFLPIIFFFLGLRDFLGVIGLVGGIFLAAQYAFIILTAKRVLNFSRIGKALAFFGALIFLAGAAYEIYYFLM